MGIFPSVLDCVTCETELKERVPSGRLFVVLVTKLGDSIHFLSQSSKGETMERSESQPVNPFAATVLGVQIPLGDICSRTFLCLVCECGHWTAKKNCVPWGLVRWQMEGLSACLKPDPVRRA